MKQINLPFGEIKFKKVIYKPENKIVHPRSTKHIILFREYFKIQTKLEINISILIQL